MPRVKIVALMSVGFPELAAACQDLHDVRLTGLEAPAELAREVADADGFIVFNGQYSAEVAALLRRDAPRLRWIQFATSGWDNALRHGVPEGVAMTNAGEAWAPAVAEHALALLLGLARDLPRLERARQARDGARHGHGLVFVKDSTVLILGLGAIGREIAVRVKALGARIIAAARRPQTHPAIDRLVPLSQLDLVLPEADAVILALALAPETHHLINAERLALMKPSAVLINVARGDILDEAALAAALGAKQLAGAGLDVYAREPLPAESPLWDLDNVILSPHVAGFGEPGALTRVVELCRDNITRFAQGAPLRNRISPGP